MKRVATVSLVLAVLGASLLRPGTVRAQEISPGEKPAEGAAQYPDGLVHTVVEGDTLWDLSARYLGTPWKWPELWERNRFVTNPHYIYPGIRIVVFPEPAKEFALKGAEAPAVPAAVAPPQAEPVPPPPAPEAAGPPTLDIAPADFVRAGEFVRRRPAGIGFIRNGTEPKIAFSEGDKVFLSLEKEIPAGQLLAVYRVRGPIPLPSDRSQSGYAKYLVGLLQVKGKEDGRPAAAVRTSFEELTSSDLISEEIPSYAPVVLDPGAPGVEATVISGRQEKQDLAERDFLFLDRGSDAGIAVGNVFRLFEDRDTTGGIPVEGVPPVRVEVGEAVVVRTSAEFSTAYVVRSTASFSAGTYARRGTAEAAK